MQSARRAYLTAVAAWPGDHAALMGLGNASYALGRQANAAEAFRSAAAADPVSDAARNNLAHVLSEMGRLDEAEAAAREAIALNGRYLDTARRTLAEILANRRNRGAGPPARN
jgi:tetratricopeptide (TPR) repeat protein